MPGAAPNRRAGPEARFPSDRRSPSTSAGRRPCRRSASEPARSPREANVIQRPLRPRPRRRRTSPPSARPARSACRPARGVGDELAGPATPPRTGAPPPVPGRTNRAVGSSPAFHRRAQTPFARYDPRRRPARAYCLVVRSRPEPKVKLNTHRSRRRSEVVSALPDTTGNPDSALRTQAVACPDPCPVREAPRKQEI
jgi:hypothetical protein